MVNELNKLIYSSLLRYGAVYIPNVGTLYLSRVPASKVSRCSISSPSISLQFSSKALASATSIVDTIAFVAQIENGQASDIFNRWLEKVRTEDEITIDGVCVIRGKSIMEAKNFRAQLNALTCETVHLKRRSNVLRNISIATLLTLIVLGAAYLLYINDIIKLNSPSNELETSPVDIVTDSANIVADNIDISDECDTIELELDTSESQEQGSVTDISATDWRLRDDICHWVVVGSYSTKENANRAISDLERKNPGLSFTSYALGSMIAVAAYGSNTYEECKEFKDAHIDLFPQAWVHTPRRYKK